MATKRRLDPRDRILLLRIALALAALKTVIVAGMHYFRGHAPIAAQLGVPERADPYLRLALLELPVWFGVVLLMPPLLRLADAFPLIGPRRWANLGVHLLAFPLAVLASAVLITVGRWPLLGIQPGGFLAHVGTYFVLVVSFFPLIYALILIGHHALVHARRVRERELDEARLESLLARARLQALQSQMQPHFLFNTLNGILGLIGEDDERARRLIVELGTMLRALAEAGDDAIELGEELALVDNYVALQEARYGDRLRFRREVPQEALAVLVPRFLLQPLVENAIKHGVERRIAPVEVRLSASLRGESLVLVVTDDGPGCSPGASEGVGLGNLRQRLRVLYGDAQSLRLERRPEGGTEVTVALPAVGTLAAPLLEAVPA